VSFDTVTTALAVLALVADAAVLAAAVCVVAARLSPRVAARVDAARLTLAPMALGLAWAAAAIGTSGSLYFSVGIGFVPCNLCWYQRIAMYPLVLILGIAVVRNDLDVRRYAGPLAAAGAILSIYHYQLERFPSQASFSCTIDVPCSVTLFTRLGFISIPWMAGSAFLLIVTLLAAARLPDDTEQPDDELAEVDEGAAG
jgi:disulfide bond formation protein DsbB